MRLLIKREKREGSFPLFAFSRIDRYKDDIFYESIENLQNVYHLRDCKEMYLR